MTAIDPSSSFVPISLQRDVIVVHRSAGYDEFRHVMIMSRDQNIERNGTIKIGDLSFEEVDKFKYLGQQ
ncbi:hypothetical protein ANN_16366 [Periplaneta americana]|uniref:Uncharacterized protein n=1 Tax=Periplaneta americana TaxID=6978 RepID=A0ABQ8SK53_PERAM|nr:hypothetical protein ANN_16366 [Periplaneta americana]